MRERSIAQHLALDGVQKRDVFADVTSGSRIAIERPGMKKALKYAEAGDTVVVYRSTGQMMLTYYVSLPEYERELIGERVNAVSQRPANSGPVLASRSLARR